MRHELDLSRYAPQPVYPLGEDFTGTSKAGETLRINSYYMEKGGAPWFGVSGELHYSRMDESRWEDELIKLRLGGVNIVSTYLFWNHIEEEEGRFDFTGRRDLRHFVSLCKRHGLYVILRVGPFDHGEVRNGGLPDWLYGKPFEVRCLDEGFLSCVKRLYGQIGKQVRGLFYKDGGPIIGVQLDNEYMHSSAMWEMTTGISNEWINRGEDGEEYLLALRRLALESGLDPVFFTGTAWGGAAYSDRILPLWGGYAYRPWLFYHQRGEHPATEEFVYEDYHHDGKKYADDFAPEYEPSSRPYACCEMGAGMQCCYYYRFVYPYKSVDALANIKLASGCNFLGYYMFHGGTNPIGRSGTYMNEAQVPKLSYDYQAALGEYGQVRESYRRLKAIHFFTQSFAGMLAPMETVLPEGTIDPRDTETLRFAVRTDGESGFLFLNNFQDHLAMPERRGDQVLIKVKSGEFKFGIDLAPEENAILPFNIPLDGITLKEAAAQPVLRTVIDGRATYVFLVPEGMTAGFRFEDGVEILGGCGHAEGSAYTLPKGVSSTLFTVKKGSSQIDILLLDRSLANSLYLLRSGALFFTDQALLEDELGGLRLETGNASSRVLTYPRDLLSASKAARPVESPESVLGAYELNARERTVPVKVSQRSGQHYTISLPGNALEGLKDGLLQIEYKGDIGQLFLGGVMISDNFSNGDTWEIGLMEHRHDLKEPLVLKISPLRQGASVNVESAMAARSETVQSSVAELISVKIKPVYEIEI